MQGRTTTTRHGVDESSFFMTLLTILGVIYINIMQFQTSSSILEFLGKFLAILIYQLHKTTPMGQ